MNRILYLIFFASAFLNLKGQSVDKIIDVKIDSLRNLGVNTFLIYHIYCPSSILPRKDSCMVKEAKFLWWSQNTKVNIQLFDNCYKYPAISTDTLQSLNFYLKNKRGINNEQIRRAEHRKVKSYEKDGKNYKSEEVTYASIDHSCFDHFKFIVDTSIVIKESNRYDLTFKQFNNGLPNTNWEYNNATKLKALIILMHKEADELRIVFNGLKE